VNITVYADESGTHDLTKAAQPGSQIVVIGGYAGFDEGWLKFCNEWQTALNKYDVRYFHFSEYANKHVCSEDNKSPYFGWAKEKWHNFLFELARIAGNRVRFPFGSSFSLVKYKTDPDIKSGLRRVGLTEGQINSPNIIYMGCFHEFFTACLEEIKIRLPDFSGAISFIFENKTDDAWKAEAHRSFDLFRKLDSRISAIGFEDGLAPEFIPLQAADMIAYRLHQMKMNELKSGKLEMLKPLDYALWGNFQPDELNEHLKKLFKD
jgi:hypothetical protein